MQKPVCIYTFQNLSKNQSHDMDKKGNHAHIISDAMGGRLRSLNTVCALCNNQTGVLDENLSRSFEIFRNLLNIQSGSNNPPPPLKNIELNTDKGKIKFDIFGGKARTQITPIKKIKENHFEYSYPKELENDKDYIRRFERQERELSKLGKIEKAVRRERYFICGKHNFDFSLSLDTDSDFYRAIAKIGFEFFAYFYKREILDASFDKVRDFIRNGTQHPNCVNWDFKHLPQIPFNSEELGPFYYSVSVWSAGKGHPVIASIVLFKGFCFTVELSKSWMGAPFGKVHAINPMARTLKKETKWIRDLNPVPILPYDWLFQRSEKAEVLQERLRELTEEIKQYSDKKSIQRTASDIAELVMSEVSEIQRKNPDFFREIDVIQWAKERAESLLIGHFKNTNEENL